MSEQISTPNTETQEIPTVTAPATTPAQADTTLSTAANVDMSLIEQKAAERAERAAQAVVRDMLKQSGLDDDAIKKMLDEYKAKQVTPEMEMKQLKDELKASKAEVAQMRQLDFLKGKGIDVEELDFYQFKAAKISKETGVTFEEAAEKYIAERPAFKRPPEFHVGGGKAAMQTMTVEEYKKLGYDDRFKLKQENPTLFEKLQSALKGK